MVIKKKEFKEQILKSIGKSYKTLPNSPTYVGFYKENEDFRVELTFRIQFDNTLSFEGASMFTFKKLEREISKLISPGLRNKYDDYFYFTSKDFYNKAEYDFFFREIETELELEEYITEFEKWLAYHEKEVFPKLLDIQFLAEYVSSVPLDEQVSLSVGGGYPVKQFKELSILKWGNQIEKYEDYKKRLAKLIEEDFLDPKYKEEAPKYKTNFESLINQLEQEPNPFV